MTAHFTLLRPQALDNSGDPISGAKLYFFDEGTTDPRTVYSDYGLTTGGATFKVADANGFFDPIYPPVGNYDVLMTDGSDVGNDYTRETTIRAKVTTQGPVDLTTFQTNTAKSETPAITTASDYTFVEADRGKSIDVNPNSATVTITLERASVAGDGTEQTIKHIGASNAVLIATVGGENIDGIEGYSLTRPGGSVTLRSNGANWKVKIEALPNTAMRHVVTERTLVSPPASPDAGSMYIMPDATLTGLWSSFSTGDLIVYLGTAGYQIVSKIIGDSAYLVEEGYETVWNGTDWVDNSNTIAPQASNLKTANFQFRRPHNVAGGSATEDAWASANLNYEHPDNNIDEISFDETTGYITFADGEKEYKIEGSQFHTYSSVVRIGLKSTTTSKILESINVDNNTVLISPGTISNQVSLSGFLRPDAGEVFEFVYYRRENNGIYSLGRPLSNGDDEIYGNLTITDLASLQGPQGVPGQQGAAGADGQDGTPGADGADGSDGVTNFYSQEAEPAGNDGDVWVKSSTGVVYIKASGVWGITATDLTGPQGIQGIQGPAGADGAGAGDLISTNNLNDIDNASTARTNLGLEIGTDVQEEISGASLTSVTVASTDKVLVQDASDSSNLKTVTAQSIADLGGGGGGDGISSDLLALAIRLADLEGDALGITDGIADPFDDESDIDTGSSSNQTFMNDKYVNNLPAANIMPAMTSGTTSGVTVTQTSYHASASGYLGWRAFDGIEADATINKAWLSNGAAPQQLSIDLGSAQDVSGYTIQATTEHLAHSPTAFTFEGSTDNSTWVVLDTQTSQSWTALETKQFNLSSTANYRYYRLNVSATGSTKVAISEMELLGAASATNMTVISDPFTADSAPSSARLMFFVKPVDSITINTDVVGAVSRDNGTTYTNATLVEVIEYSDGTKVYEAENIDISGQPSGTSMRWKLTTANLKSIEFTAALLQWS